MKELTTAQLEQVSGGLVSSVEEMLEGAVFGWMDAMATFMIIGGGPGSKSHGVGGIIAQGVGVLLGMVVGTVYGIVGGAMYGKEEFGAMMREYRETFNSGL